MTTSYLRDDHPDEPERPIQNLPVTVWPGQELAPLFAQIEAIVEAAKSERDRWGTIAATIRINALHHGASTEDAEAMVRGDKDFITFIMEKVEAQKAAPQTVAVDWQARAEAAEAALAWADEQRADAMLRRYINAPEDPHVAVLCERYGYGAVMDAASRLWARKDSLGAFYIGGCIGLRSDDEARAILTAAKEPRHG